MKESTGGTLLLGLAAAILLIFIIFAAFFINYGKTFKKKNIIINEIEQKEGISCDGVKTLYPGITDCKIDPDDKSKPGVCYKLIENGGIIVGLTYKLRLVMSFDRTILDGPVQIDIPIYGETRTIDSGDIFDSIPKSNINYNSTIQDINKCD